MAFSFPKKMTWEVLCTSSCSIVGWQFSKCLSHFCMSGEWRHWLPFVRVIFSRIFAPWSVWQILSPLWERCSLADCPFNKGIAFVWITGQSGLHCIKASFLTDCNRFSCIRCNRLEFAQNRILLLESTLLYAQLLDHPQLLEEAQMNTDTLTTAVLARNKLVFISDPGVMCLFYQHLWSRAGWFVAGGNLRPFLILMCVLSRLAEIMEHVTLYQWLI